MKFVASLTEAEITTLSDLLKYGPNYRYRQRAHMVLLSNKGYMINDLSDIFGLDRDNISIALDRWKDLGIVGLRDAPGKGRKEKLSSDYKNKIIDWVENNTPRSIKEILNYISEVLNIDVSEDTIRGLLKSSGYSWKRLRKAIKHKRDDERFEQAKTEIEVLKEKHKNGDIELHYFDATGFSLTPTVPYAWQKKGTTKSGYHHTEVKG